MHGDKIGGSGGGGGGGGSVSSGRLYLIFN
jgi:hypothetical protein